MQYTYDDFNGCIGQPFRLQLDASTSHMLELAMVDRLPDYGGASPENRRRESFSLVFRGAPDLYLNQRIYPIEHEELGEMELFLVPIGPDEKGMRFEAIFN